MILQSDKEKKNGTQFVIMFFYDFLMRYNFDKFNERMSSFLTISIK